MIGNKPSKKKRAIPVSDRLAEYLVTYKRMANLPLEYSDMTQYESAYPLLDLGGQDTLWESVVYGERVRADIFRGLSDIYALLKTGGDTSVIEHLTIDRVDFCVFGNTNPFRIRIINKLNDNYDHFYIKKIDASRIYGLELEELLSPNSVSYLVNNQTLVEEHIAGIPGDDFMKTRIDVPIFDEIRIAKEFIKFNERCFVRLLGDMRSYNYIVDITPDIEGAQYRIRAIDFDQQSYEGRKSFYLPQYFKENTSIINLGFKHLAPKAVAQYQLEERSLIARRARISRRRLNEILECMRSDHLSDPDKIEKLKSELAYHHKNNAFLACRNMGDIVLTNLKLVLDKEFVLGFLPPG